MSDKIICPICGRETAWESEPRGLFCSERCRMIDLGKWAGGEYRMPGEKVVDEKRDEGEGKEDH